MCDDEHVESKVMVDSRARAGARALCAWLRIGVGGGTLEWPSSMK